MSRTRRSRLLLSAVLCLLAGLALPAQTPGVKIDGRTDDWTPLALSRDARSGAEYAFRNDGRNLYVLFIVKEPKARESLESTGLLLLAGKARAKKLDRGVLFLKRPFPAETYILWQESQGAFLTEPEKAKLRDTPQHDLCLTFAVGARRSVSGPLRRLQDSEPPKFAVAEGPDGTIYELEVPLAAPAHVPGGLGLSPGETVRVAFEWGGASRDVLGTKAGRETPPAEKGGLAGVATPAQEFLNMFDALSRPTMRTKEYSFTVDVMLVIGR
jgi:hypothetical protein